jgi:hypothetical protein
MSQLRTNGRDSAYSVDLNDSPVGVFRQPREGGEEVTSSTYQQNGWPSQIAALSNGVQAIWTHHK